MDKHTQLFAGINIIDEQLNLAKSHYTEQRYANAHYWFQMASLRGSTEAQYFLGVMYTEGQGVKKDISEAITWTCSAAMRGNQFAIQCIQSDEYTGHRAILLEDINRFHPSDQYKIGLLFHNLEEPEDHDQIAFNFFEKAAIQGIIEAKHMMRWMQYNNLPNGPLSLSQFASEQYWSSQNQQQYVTLQYSAYAACLGSKRAHEQLLSLINANTNFRYVGEITLQNEEEIIVLYGYFYLNKTKYEILGQGSYGLVIRTCTEMKYCLKLDINTRYDNDNLNLFLSLLCDLSAKPSSDTSSGFTSPHRTIRIFNDINRELIDRDVIEEAQVVTFCGSKVVMLPLLTPISIDDSDDRDQAYTDMASRCLQIYMDSGRIIPDIIGINNAMWSDNTEARELVFNDIPNSYRRESSAGLSFFHTSNSNLPNNIFNDYANYWKSYADACHCIKTVIKILVGLIVYDYDQSQVEQDQKEHATQTPIDYLDLEEIALNKYDSLFNEVCKYARPTKPYNYLENDSWSKLRELMRKLNPDAPSFTEQEEETVFVTKKIKTSR
jgi:hypothetical protein